VMEYLSQREYRRLKSNLTRATNSGDPLKVIKACREARDAFEGCVWPDDWNRWASAHRDAAHQLQREAMDW